MAERHSQLWRKSNKTNGKRARSLNRIRPELGKVRSDRSSSRSTDTSEKILNTDLNKNDSEMFFEVCNTFERVLKELNLSQNSDRVREKLTKIGGLIEKKISLAKKANRKSSDPLLNLDGLSLNNLSQSRRSLLSESTNDSDNSEGNSRYKKFMKEVTCPFCSEIQSDKVDFVKHLDRSCSAHLKKDFKKKEAHFPYSAFQILPSNLIKCNICHNQVQEDLRLYYDHTQSQIHKRSYANAARIRDYDNRLFCVCCKALVYNNYTQIKGHIDQEAHISNCGRKKTTADFLHSGIHFVFTDSYKFKCLDCPPASAVCSTPKSALEHLDNPNHKKHKKKNTFYSSAIYCEVCSVQVQLYEIITHFSSSQHCANEKILKEESFEVCLYCNFFCKSLLKLSKHMESECVEINNLRKKIPKEIQGEKEANITKGPSITVKNCTKIPALFRYFTQFGEIVTIENQNDKDVVIEFREKSAVDDVSLLQDVIVLDGTKLEIAIGLKSGESGEKPTPETESRSEDSENSSKSEDDADLSNDSAMIQDGRLDELFARVSNYLINTARKLNSTEKLAVQHDCIRTLEHEKCLLVGFSGSGLSFPSETINLFCGYSGSRSLAFPFFVPSQSEMSTENLLKAFHIRICDSKSWQNAQCYMTQGPYPFLECMHSDTQSLCRIFVNKSALVLTDMLRECLDKSQVVKPFCLMVRFWLSVHELKIKDFEFALISLLVFFLISVNVVTLSEEKYRIQAAAWFYFLSREQVEAFPASLRDLKLTINVKELFQEFLQFMDSFDFDKYAICLPLRCPVPRSSLNKQLFQYLSDKKDIDSLKSCGMCILDPTSCANVAADIDHQHKKEFLKIIGATIRHCKIK